MKRCAIVSIMQDDYTTESRGRWGKLRPGLLTDLGYKAVADLAADIGYPNVDDIELALDGATPSDGLMSALFRTFPTLPALYFIEKPERTVQAAS